MPRRVPIRASLPPSPPADGAAAVSRPTGDPPPVTDLRRSAGGRRGAAELEGWRPLVTVRGGADRSAMAGSSRAAVSDASRRPAHDVHLSSLPHQAEQVVEPGPAPAARTVSTRHQTFPTERKSP